MKKYFIRKCNYFSNLINNVSGVNIKYVYKNLTEIELIIYVVNFLFKTDKSFFSLVPPQLSIIDFSLYK